ncbi:hypothetical protein ACFV2N_44450 [Streptomyces sp. NPDC059680]|uniref:hypothetical protein n=1 Tax=Streptomyces sp. NPDC059680 TaxID=3346904 RepID=UPI0036BA5255
MDSEPTHAPSADSASEGRRCHGPFGAAAKGTRCPDRARFIVSRHIDFPLPVCPEHLGPALLLARNVLWPPHISLVR